MIPCVRTRVRQRFILIGPCSDLCRTVRANGWACLSLTSLLVSFLAMPSCRWKSTCDPAMPYISKITKGETEQLIALVPENVALYDKSYDDYSTSSALKQTLNDGFQWTGAMNDAGKKGGKREENTEVCINTTKNLRNSVCIKCQSCTHTKLLPDALTHAISFSVSVQMDSRLKSDRICADVKAFWYPRFQLTIVFYSLAVYRVDLVKDWKCGI